MHHVGGAVIPPFQAPLITKLYFIFIIFIYSSSGDLQPSTAIANQLPGH